ncbi:DUF2851 family protein [Pedobacter sp. SYP-B3415]|uniref:DUF2851 family protein n=1 Tax=Pedobacter sp. SYP-B3415 TaxID=2496641 RepID=UPI00101C1553|nr:DUF2851 family protein [Pedobacter sp. SYP-B3415]
MYFSEEFLHYIWRFRRYEPAALVCDGEPVQVLAPGSYHQDSGPDFSLAQIRIGKTLWVGDVEIHIKTSDWLLHGHQHDEAYNNVILHVVYEHDQKITRPDGSPLPVLSLHNHVSLGLVDTYNRLQLSQGYFPCAATIGQANKTVVKAMLTRQLIARLEKKSAEVLQTLALLKGDWEETFYRFLARNFGFKVNAQPFELLARLLPYRILARCRGNRFQMEALLFGVAGMLDHLRTEDLYPVKLQREFTYLQKKYRLKKVPISMWKFMRMRPQNFPSLRIAQFAALLNRPEPFFAGILALRQPEDISSLFGRCNMHTFWTEHYHFGKRARQVGSGLGKDSVHNLLVNTVSLFLFVYGRYTGNEMYVQLALNLLEAIPPEDNTIIRNYCRAGLDIDNAFFSQAVLELKKNWCDGKKCVHCSIGINLLKNV